MNVREEITGRHTTERIVVWVDGKGDREAMCKIANAAVRVHVRSVIWRFIQRYVYFGLYVPLVPPVRRTFLPDRSKSFGVGRGGVGSISREGYGLLEREKLKEEE